MTETKRWFLSKTVWAQVLGIIILLADAFGVTPAPPDDQTAELIAVATNAFGFIFRLIARTRLTR